MFTEVRLWMGDLYVPASVFLSQKHVRSLTVVTNSKKSVCLGSPKVNTSPLVHEIASLDPGKYQCVFFIAYVLFKLILNITGIGEGKHREET